MDIKKLIEDVIIDLANNATLDSVSSKVQVISRLLKNEKFKKWVDCEFVYGYKLEEEIPNYRIIFIVGVQADYIAPAPGGMIKYTNQMVPIENLGAEKYKRIAKIAIPNTISLVQQAIQPNRDICLTVEPYESSYIQEVLDGCHIMSMRKIISRQQYQNIIDTTKANLIDFFVELNDSVLNKSIDFNVMTKKTDIERVVNNTIYASVVNSGDGHIEIADSTVIGGKDNSVNISSDIRQQLNNIVNEIETLSQEINEDRTDIAEAIIAVKEELRCPNINRSSLKLAFHAIKGAISGAIDTGVTELVEQAVRLIK